MPKFYLVFFVASLSFYISLLTPDTTNFDSLVVFNKTYKICGQVQPDNKPNLCEIKCCKESKKLIYVDDFSSDLVQQQGGTKYSAYDVIGVSSGKKMKRKRQWNALLDTLEVNFKFQNYGSVFLCSPNDTIRLEEIRITVIDTKGHYEHKLVNPLKQKTFSDLMNPSSTPVLVVIEDIVFTKDEQKIVLPYQFILQNKDY